MNFDPSAVFTVLLSTAAIIVVITGLVYAGGARRAKRYRPGRPFTFAPVWFLSSPERLAGNAAIGAGPAGSAAAELAAGPGAPELPAVAPVIAIGPTGGASDRW